MTKQENNSGVVKLRRNLFWIIFVFLGVYIVLSGFGYLPWYFFLWAVGDHLSDGMHYIMEYYTSTFVGVVFLFLLTWLIRSNRYVWFFNYKGMSEVRHITHLYARSLPFTPFFN